MTVAATNLVIQEDDELYFAEMGTQSARLRDLLTSPPALED